MSKIIIFSESDTPPTVNLEVSKDIYDCVRTEEFEPHIFNALLMAAVTYLDVHNVKYEDKRLPWAEEVSTLQ